MVIIQRMDMSLFLYSSNTRHSLTLHTQDEPQNATYCPDLRVPCKYCDRKFRDDLIDKHEAICQQVNRKRPVFNIKHKQFPHLETTLSKCIITNKKKNCTEKFLNTKWYKQHMDLVSKMKYGRETGASPPPDLHEDYKQCPYCFRKFAPIPAYRHIPKCKDTIHKPKPPPGVSEASIHLPGIQKKTSNTRKRNKENVHSRYMCEEIYRFPKVTGPLREIKEAIKSEKIVLSNQIYCSNISKLKVRGKTSTERST